MIRDENVVFDNQNDPNQPQQGVQVPAQGIGSVQQQDPAQNQLPVENQQPVDQAFGQNSAPIDNQSLPTEGAPPAEPPVDDLSSSPPGFFNALPLKKIIIGVGVLLLVVFLVILFMPKNNEQKDVTLTWWGLWEDEAVMKILTDEFTRENPKIKVNYVQQNPRQYRERITARIGNNKTDDVPDVFVYHNSWTPMFSSILLPFSEDVITPEEFEKAYYPVMQDDLVKNGAIYGIPLGVDTLALFVNTKYLKDADIDPPKTWDDFTAATVGLTVYDESTGRIATAGAALGTYNNITHASDILSLLFVQQGIDMKNFPASADRQQQVFDFYTSFAKGQKPSWNTTLDESILTFSSGRLAMFFGYSWDILRIKALNPDLEFSIHPVPSLPGGEKVAFASYWAQGISSKSPYQKEALVFMKYLAKKETAEKLFAEASKTREFGQPYARTDLADTLKENQLLYPFILQLPYAKSSVFSSDTQDGEGGINSISNTYLGNAVNAIVSENGSIKSSISTLSDGIRQVYNKYGIR